MQDNNIKNYDGNFERCQSRDVDLQSRPSGREKGVVIRSRT